MQTSTNGAMGSERPDEVIAVIQNVLYRLDPGTVAAGDLFLEPSRATCLIYTAGISQAPIVYGAAALLGGLVGLVATSLKR